MCSCLVSVFFITLCLCVSFAFGERTNQKKKKKSPSNRETDRAKLFQVIDFKATLYIHLRRMRLEWLEIVCSSLSNHLSMDHFVILKNAWTCQYIWFCVAPTQFMGNHNNKSVKILLGLLLLLLLVRMWRCRNNILWIISMLMACKSATLKKKSIVCSVLHGPRVCVFISSKLNANHWLLWRWHFVNECELRFCWCSRHGSRLMVAVSLNF